MQHSRRQPRCPLLEREDDGVLGVSPCTGFTLTCTDVFSPNGTSGKSLKVTVLLSPISSRSIVCVFTMGVVPFGIVNVTTTLTS